MLFHLLTNDKGELGFSPLPYVDRLLGEWSCYLCPGLPLEKLELYIGKVDGSAERDRASQEEQKKRIIRLIQRELIRDGGMLTGRLRWEEIETASLEGSSHGELHLDRILQDDALFNSFMHQIRGRQLSDRELAHLSKSLDLTEQGVLALIQKAIYNGWGKWIPALEQEKSSRKCVRCGSSEFFEWPSLYGQAFTCEKCKVMGALSTLNAIFRLKISKNIQTDSELKSSRFKHTETESQFSEPDRSSEGNSRETNRDDLEKYTVQFTSVQRRAAQSLLEIIGKKQEKELLLWAACGAGKTEVCFPLIQRYLTMNKLVLFAAPRQDVVHDIQPRLQDNFPEYKVGIHSGAMPANFEAEQLTVATTHQVLRFYRHFDLIILDEMDAYPYAGSEILQYGLSQALKDDGQVVYLTATPSEEVLKKVARGSCQIVRLPLRHHGKELPLPELQKMALPERNTSCREIRNKKSGALLIKWIKELKEDGPVLIFVPTIPMVKEWTDVLRAWFPNEKITGSWSNDPNRRSKVTALTSGEYDIFVSTSILERGVTIQKVQVIVLYAHHDLFNTRTLVQMAGRTGRTTACPTGRVLFVASKETESIITSRKWIEEQNFSAQAGGCLNA